MSAYTEADPASLTDSKSAPVVSLGGEEKSEVTSQTSQINLRLSSPVDDASLQLGPMSPTSLLVSSILAVAAQITAPPPADMLDSSPDISPPSALLRAPAEPASQDKTQVVMSFIMFFSTIFVSSNDCRYYLFLRMIHRTIS